MDEPSSPPPAAAPPSESRLETSARANPRDEEVRGCCLVCALIIGALAFSVTGPVGAFLALLVLLAMYLSRGVFAALFSMLAAHTGVRPVAVPRRFGIGSLLVVTAAFAMFLGAMQSLRVDPIVMGLVTTYVAVVGVGQAVLFGGKSPRRASMLVGMLFPLVVGFVIVVYGLITDGRNNFPDFLAAVVCIAILSIAFGVPFGYFAGTLAAGVFFVIERVCGRSNDGD